MKILSAQMRSEGGQVIWTRQLPHGTSSACEETLVSFLLLWFFVHDTRVLVARGLDPIAFPYSSRQAANLAGAEEHLFCRKEALANHISFMIDVEAQPAELLVHLQDFKLPSGFPLES